MLIERMIHYTNLKQTKIAAKLEKIDDIVTGVIVVDNDELLLYLTSDGVVYEVR